MSYNGWSNYATWRVYVDIFSDYDFDDTFDLLNNEDCKEITTQILFEDNDFIATNLIAQYAGLFLSEVNFNEIAEHVNEIIKDNQV